MLVVGTDDVNVCNLLADIGEMISTSRMNESVHARGNRAVIASTSNGSSVLLFFAYPSYNDQVVASRQIKYVASGGC